MEILIVIDLEGNRHEIPLADWAHFEGKGWEKAEAEPEESKKQNKKQK